MRQRDAFNEICEIHGGLRAMHSNCGNIIPDDQCPSCHEILADCQCWSYCIECSGRTNHTAAQHEAVVAEQMLCHECGINPKLDDDPETRVCRACYDENLAWRAADNYDSQAKEAK